MPCAHARTHTHTHTHARTAANWGLHSDPMFERNYCADNFLTVYFNVSYPSYLQATGEAALKAQLYLAIVAQALVVKSDISTRRARNSFGTVTWQHNEIWPTVRMMANPPMDGG